MKKSVIIILAVAIIGVLGVFAKSHKDEDTASPSPSRVQAITSNTPSQPTGTSGGSSSSSAAAYKDGTYTGQAEETEYGTVQVAAVVSGGKITDIEFLQMPGPEGHSREITSVAGPMLKQETLNSQSANVDFVSGATTTSSAYEQSLQAALDQAALS